MKARAASALLALGLAGCAAPESGTATTRVQVDIVVRDCSLDNGGAITITTTETTTPTSTADQKADARVDAKAEVPVGPR